MSWWIWILSARVGSKVSWSATGVLSNDKVDVSSQRGGGEGVSAGTYVDSLTVCTGLDEVRSGILKWSAAGEKNFLGRQMNRVNI